VPGEADERSVVSDMHAGGGGESQATELHGLSLPPEPPEPLLVLGLGRFGSGMSVRAPQAEATVMKSVPSKANRLEFMMRSQ
jgi:hypothetical protein